MKRRIVRSFFITLLLLCVGGWVASYKVYWSVCYWGSQQWSAEAIWGELHFQWWAVKGRYRWFIDTMPADESLAEDRDSFAGDGFLGFNVDLTPDDDGSKDVNLAIPFWFPTTLFTIALLLAWRKVRPKPEGRAFPVEAGEMGDKP